MMQSTAPGAPVQNWHEIRDAWVRDVEQMAADVERWCAARDLFVKRETKDLDEEEIGSYQLPVLTIQLPTGRIYFNPIARFIVGAEGRIEMYAVPSFAQVVLIRRGNGW